MASILPFIFCRCLDLVQIFMIGASVVILANFLGKEDSYLSVTFEYIMTAITVLLLMCEVIYFFAKVMFFGLTDDTEREGMRTKMYFWNYVLLVLAIIAEVMIAMIALAFMNAEDELKDKISTGHFASLIFLMISVIGIRGTLAFFTIGLNKEDEYRFEEPAIELQILRRLPSTRKRADGRPDSPLGPGDPGDPGNSGGPGDSVNQRDPEGHANAEGAEKQIQSHQNTDFKKLPSPDRRRSAKCVSGVRASKDQSSSSGMDSSYFSQGSGERVAEVRIEDEQVFFQKEDSRPQASAC